MKNLKIASALLVIITILFSRKKKGNTPDVDVTTGLHIKDGKYLADKCGNKVILRGVNMGNVTDPITIFGVAGVLGLEYKFKGIPLAISADWQPIYLLNENSGFSAENGGIGIKYTF